MGTEYTPGKQLTLQPPRSPVNSHGFWLRVLLFRIPVGHDQPLSQQTQSGEPTPWLPQWTGLPGVSQADYNS
jgi:hypothetical protein